MTVKDEASPAAAAVTVESKKLGSGQLADNEEQVELVHRDNNNNSIDEDPTQAQPDTATTNLGKANTRKSSSCTAKKFTKKASSALSELMEQHRAAVAMPLYVHPKQRQRWGDTQVHPVKNWGTCGNCMLRLQATHTECRIKPSSSDPVELLTSVLPLFLQATFSLTCFTWQRKYSITESSRCGAMAETPILWLLVFLLLLSLPICSGFRTVRTILVTCSNTIQHPVDCCIWWDVSFLSLVCGCKNLFTTHAFMWVMICSIGFTKWLCFWPLPVPFCTSNPWQYWNTDTNPRPCLRMHSVLRWDVPWRRDGSLKWHSSNDSSHIVR